MCVHHGAVKHRCDPLDAENRTWIPLKRGRLTIRAPRFTVEHTFKNAPVSDSASTVPTAMVSELRVHAAANVIDMFLQAPCSLVIHSRFC
ncbi:hypothetical protein TNCV_490271 [Trichonephila clavipes]|nr:hypothetical protein TNCV_490271 [Trichonephila clavipes]